VRARDSVEPEGERRPEPRAQRDLGRDVVRQGQSRGQHLALGQMPQAGGEGRQGLDVCGEDRSRVPQILVQQREGPAKVLDGLGGAGAVLSCMQRDVQCPGGRAKDLHLDAADSLALCLGRQFRPCDRRRSADAVQAHVEIDDRVISFADPRLPGRRVAQRMLTRGVGDEAERAQDRVGLLELGRRDQEIDVAVAPPGSIRVEPVRE
jgi:hypothetical protein